MSKPRSETILSKASAYRDFTAGNLSAMVKIPSLSGEEDRVISEIKKQILEAGFEEVRIDGLGNLIGRVGRGKRILAIDAHIDTVDTGDRSQWSKDPFSGEISGGFVHGRGTVDQEGGAAAMVTAGRILREMGYAGAFTVWFAFTVMEEDCDGLCWKYLIEEEKLRPDFAVSTEPTNLRVTRGHRGRLEMELRTKGISCHGSAPERGDNAIYKGARACLEIEKLNDRLAADPFLGKGTITVTAISSASPSLCAVPDGCMFHMDRRLTWGETMESAIAEVYEAVEPGAEIVVPEYRRASWKGTIFPQEKYFPTWKIEEDHPLVRAGVESYRTLFNADPVVDKWTFSTNAVSICGRYGIPTIGFGPGDESLAHSPNERIPIDHLEKASAFYAMLPYILEENV